MTRTPTNDDRRIDDPDAEPTAAELADATQFAAMLDGAPTTEGMAMAMHDVALFEMAVVIRAATGAASVALAPARQAAIVEAAVRQGAGITPITALADARAQRTRTPWLAAIGTGVIAVAAGALMLLRGPAGPAPAPATTAEAARQPMPEAWTSRPADALVGEIAPTAAASADVRIDRIFADRLDGFRDRQLSRGTP